MGFLPDVRRILDLTPADRQTLLFSATLDGDIDVLVRRYQHHPVPSRARGRGRRQRRASLLAGAARRPGGQDGRLPRHRVRPSCSAGPSTAPTGSPVSSSSVVSGRRHPRRPEPEQRERALDRLRPGRGGRPGGHRRRRPRDPRRRGDLRGPLRPSGRRQGLRPPFGPDGAGPEPGVVVSLVTDAVARRHGRACGATSTWPAPLRPATTGAPVRPPTAGRRPRPEPSRREPGSRQPDSTSEPGSRQERAGQGGTQRNPYGQGGQGQFARGGRNGKPRPAGGRRPAAPAARRDDRRTDGRPRRPASER